MIDSNEPIDPVDITESSMRAMSDQELLLLIEVLKDRRSELYRRARKAGYRIESINLILNKRKG